VADLPHFAFPFQRGRNGKVNVVEQDTEQHVMSCEALIVRYPRGFRVSRPEFGWNWPLFKTLPLDLSGLEEALATFEPRGRADASQWADAAEKAAQHISVEVGI